MFIRATSSINRSSEILINKDHIKWCRSSWSGTKEDKICTVKFYGADDNIIGERVLGKGDQEIIDMLTTTLVPVASAGFSLLRIRDKDEGYGELTLEETPIIAFRVYEDYGFPLPIVVDDCNNDIMSIRGLWGIKMPNGRVSVPYDCDFDTVEAFMADAKKKEKALATHKFFK